MLAKAAWRSLYCTVPVSTISDQADAMSPSLHEKYIYSALFQMDVLLQNSLGTSEYRTNSILIVGPVFELMAATI